MMNTLSLLSKPIGQWILAGILALFAGWVYREVPKQRLTRLDDSIFIEENYPINRDKSAYSKALTRGVFREKGDNYYRPLLLWSFAADAGMHQLKLEGYLQTNVRLHLISCVLLFLALCSLGLPPLSAWILGLIFAVHPALSQTVAWIPGRNDSLLALATFSGLIALVKYWGKGQWPWLLLWGLCGLAAILTKETGVVVMPAMVGLVWAFRGLPQSSKAWIALGLVWCMVIGIWVWGRSEAETVGTGLNPSNLFVLFWERTPILLQYLGKTFLPLNLSVFPMQADTDWHWGAVALGMLGFLVCWTPAQDRLKWVGGLAFWFLLLLPAMVVPKGLNDQVFEHRLYVPTLGLWAAVGSSNLFRYKLSGYFRVALTCLVLACFLQINVSRRAIFADELAFWKDAVDHSPSSAYAHVMYAIRCNTVEGLPKPGLEEARKYINKAYAIDSNEKYVNHYMGLLALEDGKIQEAARFFEREIFVTALADSYFHRANALFKLGDKRGSARSLEEFLRLKPGDPTATNNLTLLYRELGITQP